MASSPFKATNGCEITVDSWINLLVAKSSIVKARILPNCVLLLEYIGTDYVMWRFVSIDLHNNVNVYAYDRHQIPSVSYAVLAFDLWSKSPLYSSPIGNPLQLDKMDLSKKIDYLIQSKSDCPLCGSEMIERKGKYGKFYSCSSWPSTKCPAIWNKDKKPNAKTFELILKKNKENKGDNKTEEEKKIEFEGINMLDL